MAESTMDDSDCEREVVVKMLPAGIPVEVVPQGTYELLAKTLKVVREIAFGGSGRYCPECKSWTFYREEGEGLRTCCTCCTCRSVTVDAAARFRQICRDVLAETEAKKPDTRGVDLLRGKQAASEPGQTVMAQSPEEAAEAALVQHPKCGSCLHRPLGTYVCGHGEYLHVLTPEEFRSGCSDYEKDNG